VQTQPTQPRRSIAWYLGHFFKAILKTIGVTFLWWFFFGLLPTFRVVVSVFGASRDFWFEAALFLQYWEGALRLYVVIIAFVYFLFISPWLKSRRK
jgi:hypothetical protein